MAEEISFGERLKLERLRLGLTQEKLADEFGKQFPGDSVTRLTISRWETGENSPSLYNLKHLVIVLGLDQKGVDAFYRAARQLPETENSLSVAPLDPSNSIASAQAPPYIDNLPFQRNQFFTGREEHLERLRKLLQETVTAKITQPISISGLGGIGKTELALEYSHRHHQDVYQTVLWVDADTTTIQASYANLAEILKLPERNEQELYRRIQAVKNWLKEHTNWLLIMDNANDLPLAESFLPAKPLGHVVFTTQSLIIGISPRQIEIKAMEPEDGLRLLLRRSLPKVEATLDTLDQENREAALQVVELLGGHPLALDQAGAYIQGTGVSFSDYMQRYRKERRCLLNKRRSLKSKDSEYSRHPLPVAATLELSIKEAGGQHPLATDILYLCAFLQPDAIPEELFAHDDSFKYGTTEFDDAIAALHSYSLIRRNTHEKTFSIHRLVQAVLIDDMSSDLQGQWRMRVVRALLAVLKHIPDLIDYDMITDDGDYRPAFGIPINRLLPHAMNCTTWTEDELTPTVEVAKLFDVLGIFLSDYGYLSIAEQLLARVLPIYEQHYGVDSQITADVKRDLALCYIAQGKEEQGWPLYRRATSILSPSLAAQWRSTGEE